VYLTGVSTAQGTGAVVHWVPTINLAGLRVDEAQAKAALQDFVGGFSYHAKIFWNDMLVATTPPTGDPSSGGSFECGYRLPTTSSANTNKLRLQIWAVSERFRLTPLRSGLFTPE
jgi:hypothetical protein